MGSQIAIETKTILILGIEKGSVNLIMSDGGETIASRNDKIVWDIALDSKVDEIIAIRRKDSSDDVFEPNEQPKRENGTKKWKGKIKGHMDVPKTEKYSIHYKKVGDSQIYIYDPIIRVNS
jgi:hypothetical protein